MPVTVLNDSKNVLTGKPAVAGSIYRAPLSGSPTVPTDSTTALAAAFKCLGYISEDGMKNSWDNDNEEIKAWGGEIVLNVNKSSTDKFKCKLIEALNDDVQKAVFGDDNVTITAATSSAPKTVAVKKNSKESPYCCWVVEMVLRDGNIKRIVIPNGKITEVAEISYKDDDAVGYDITISAEKDSDGNTHYEYMTIGTATT
jgi:hypothetical protein